MKRLRSILFAALALSLVASPFPASAAGAATDGMMDRVRGQILLQVEDHGEAWYVDPATDEAHYLRDGNAAYQIMRDLGLGITDADLAKILSAPGSSETRNASSTCETNEVARRVRGRIVIQVEQHGEAWYVFPDNCRRVYMADGDAAYRIMRELGLGATTADIERIVTRRRHLLGDINAPYRLLTFADLEGPFGARFAPSVRDAVDDYNGLLVAEFRHFPLSFHPNARDAAIASECASDQGKFYEMHDALFADQSGFSRGHYLALASDIGLNVTAFRECLDSGRYEDLIKRHVEEGRSMGVNGTPNSFVIRPDGTSVRVNGAVPYETLLTAIEEAMGSRPLSEEEVEDFFGNVPMPDLLPPPDLFGGEPVHPYLDQWSDCDEASVETVGGIETARCLVETSYGGMKTELTYRRNLSTREAWVDITSWITDAQSVYAGANGNLMETKPLVTNLACEAFASLFHDPSVIVGRVSELFGEVPTEAELEEVRQEVLEDHEVFGGDIRRDIDFRLIDAETGLDVASCKATSADPASIRYMAIESFGGRDTLLDVQIGDGNGGFDALIGALQAAVEGQADPDFFNLPYIDLLDLLDPGAELLVG